MKQGMILLVFFCLNAIAFSQTWYVPDDFGSIQSAIDFAAEGDTIIVRPGTYEETIDFLGKAMRVTSEEGPEATIINGDDAGSVVTFQSGETSDSVLDGFTLTDGDGTSFLDFGHCGGGVFCINGSSPLLINNWINNNTAHGKGGGIFCHESSPAIKNNLVIDNSAGYGGGICCWSSSPEIRNNTINENSVLRDCRFGAGILCWNGSSPIVSHNSISGNRGGEHCWGCGIACVGYSNPMIMNNLITENISQTPRGESIGGGIGCLFYCSPEIENNIVSGNAACYGGGIGSYVYCSLQVKGNSITGNEAYLCGGGMYTSYNDLLTASGNTISGNLAGCGGGGISCGGDPQGGENIYPGDSFATLSNNMVLGNVSGHDGCPGCGGGIYAFGDASLTNNVIAGNSSGYGGGIDAHSPLFNSGPTLFTVSGNTIFGNSALNKAGGLLVDSCYGQCDCIVTNTIFWNNNAPEGPEIFLKDGYYPSEPPSVTIFWSDVEGGVGSVVVEDYGVLNWGKGMIDADPLFVNAAGDDYHLSQDPCQPGVANLLVDAGDPGTVPEGHTRTDGVDDIKTVDIGYHSKVLVVPTAVATISEAINLAAKGGTILVKPGIYFEQIEFLGKSLNVRSEQGPWVTVIDGMQAGSVVSFRDGCEGNVLDGFTIRNGRAQKGGGIYLSHASPTLKNNIITGNLVELPVGQVSPFGGKSSGAPRPPSQGAAASRGGGIYCGDSSPVLINNIIWGNTTRPDGSLSAGGVIQPGVGQGGGIFCCGAGPTLINNTITQNSAQKGGGIYFTGDGSNTAYAANNIIWNNESQVGQEICLGASFPPSLSILTLRYCDLDGGEALVYLAPGCIFNGWEGMIDADPLFAVPGAGDFHLTWGSPCMDAGSNLAPALPLHDIEGDGRIINGIVDMGADEL